jgi:hypothetical protein
VKRLRRIEYIYSSDVSWLQIFCKLDIVGLTGYVHIMREGGKPVVVLLDVLMCVSSFLRRKRLDIGSRQECTGAETVVYCCSDRQMYRSRNCRMPLFRQI